MVLTDSRSANELLGAFTRTGDEALFEEVVRRYAGMVYHVAYRVTKNQHDAEDATQAAFLSLAVQCRAGKTITAIGPWLQQVTHRLSLDIRRSHRRRDARELKHFELNRDRLSDGGDSNGNHNGNGDHNGEGSYFGGYDSEELKHLVSAAIDGLPTRYRMPMVLLYFGGMSREQISRELRCKISTLAVRIHRGREMVRKQLSKRGIVLSVDSLTLLLTQVIRSNVGMGLMQATSTAAGQLAQGMFIDPVAVSTQVLALARRATEGVLLARIRLAVASVIIFAPMLLAASRVAHYIGPGNMNLLAPVQWIGDSIRSLFTHSLPLSVPRVSNTNPTPESPLTTDRIEQPRPVVVASEIEPRLIVKSSAGKHQDTTAISLMSSGYAAPSVARPSIVIPVAEPISPEAPRRILADALSAAPIYRNVNPKSESAANSAAIAGTHSPAPISSANENSSATNDPEAYASASWGGSGGGGGSGTPIEKQSLRNQITSGSVSTAAATSTFGSGTTYTVQNVSDTSSTPAIKLPKKTTLKLGDPAIAAADAELSTSTLASTAATASPGIIADGVLALNPLAPTDTFQGWGSVPASAPFYVNAKVVADGMGRGQTLDLSHVSIHTNVENAPLGGTIGWYAKNTGRLLLPSLVVNPGTSSITWGESAQDKRLDLVNSARLTLHDVTTPGDATISLLANNNPLVPTLPPSHHFIGIWSYDQTAEVDGMTDLRIRYDSELAAAQGLNESILKLWVYDGKWIRIMDSTFGRDVQNHLIWGSYSGDFTFFAVSAPEPTGAALLLCSSLMLLKRHRRRHLPE